MLSLGGVVFSGLWIALRGWRPYGGVVLVERGPWGVLPLGDIALRGWGPYGGVVLVERGPWGVLPLGDVVLVGVVLRGCCP